MCRIKRAHGFVDSSSIRHVMSLLAYFYTFKTDVSYRGAVCFFVFGFNVLARKGNHCGQASVTD